jgi:hypothetical protein
MYIHYLIVVMDIFDRFFTHKWIISSMDLHTVLQ